MRTSNAFSLTCVMALAAIGNLLAGCGDPADSTGTGSTGGSGGTTATATGDGASDHGSDGGTADAGAESDADATFNAGQMTAADRDGSADSASALGRPCGVDADCGSLTCIKASDASFGGGGPARGYCTLPCTTAMDPVCTAIGGVCLDFARTPSDPPATFCVESCRRGDVDAGAESKTDAEAAAKCHGRHEVACTPASVLDGQPSVEGYCLPACNSDAECGGRHCDPARGICIDEAAGGLPTGAPCGGADVTGNPAGGAADSGDLSEAGDFSEAASAPDGGATTGCAGVCLSVGGTAHVCAQRCAYGSPDACHPPDASPVSTADGGAGSYSACVFIAPGTGTGDEAYCGQLCDTDADCLDKRDPGIYCDTSDGAVAAYGHGFCNVRGIAAR